MEGERELDIVVFGATGFVGKLTAEYLAEHAPEGVKIGLAGRSEEKLARVKSEVGKDWPTIVADSSDAASMKALAERCRVVATTVGPYRKYGMPLVEACADAGTDYIDLTGEPLFIRDSIDRCHERAAESGREDRALLRLRLDPVGPRRLALARGGRRARGDDVRREGRARRGERRHGRLDDDDARRGEGRRPPAKASVRPYSLSPDRDAEPDLGRQLDFGPPSHDDDIGQWLAPFVMGAINTRTVRRSNALQDWAYGRRFRYRETMATGSGVVGLAKATALVGGLGAMTGVLAVPPVRSALGRFIPSPGEGPSEEAREKGFFKIEIHARTPAGERYVRRVSAQGDPGYAATAVMFGETALCLAVDRDALPARAGVLTPATALDGPLVERLRAAGHTYEVEKL